MYYLSVEHWQLSESLSTKKRKYNFALLKILKNHVKILFHQAIEMYYQISSVIPILCCCFFAIVNERIIELLWTIRE